MSKQSMVYLSHGFFNECQCTEENVHNIKLDHRFSTGDYSAYRQTFSKVWKDIFGFRNLQEEVILAFSG